mgnify:CR=1 FL=1
MKEIKASTVRRRYARLPLALALGAMVLSPALMGGVSEAEANVGTKGETSISITGNARIMGFWTENDDFNDDVEDVKRGLRHRLRLMLDGTLAGGTSFHSRLNITGWDNWNGASPGAGSLTTDWLYFKVPLASDLTVVAGRQKINYGHKFRVWDGRSDRLTFVKKMNDELSLLAFYAKEAETDAAATASDVLEDGDDENLYAIGGEYKGKPLSGGFRIMHYDEQWSGGDNGQRLSGYLTHKSGDLTTKFEADFSMGDRWKNNDGDNRYGLLLDFDYKMGDTTLSAGVAAAMNGYVVDNDFDAITAFYDTGAGHGLAYARMGQVAETADSTGTITSADMESEYAAGIGVSHKMSPKVKLAANLAYITAETITGGDADGVVLDGQMGYKINGSTTYYINGIYASPNDVTAQDDAYWGLSHRFEIKF